jgi:hypothetical protein
MKRTTFLALLAVAVWAAALGVGNAKPGPGECAVCHTRTGLQDFGDTTASETHTVSIYTLPATDDDYYKPGMARMTGYLFSKSPDMPGALVSGRGQSHRGAYTVATTGLRG